jgi:uncharacterized membrane protein
MNHFAEFLKTTLIGGLLVLFPLFGCLYLTFRIAGALTSVIKPLLNFLPQNRLVGVAVADAASVLILLILCFVIGLILKTSVGNALGVQITRLLNLIPGYRMFGRVARVLFDHEDPRGSPVLVRRGQTKQIGFMVEQNSADEMTVFFPSAPSPFSGNIVIVKADTVEKLNVPAAEVARVIATFGAGTRGLLADGERKHADEGLSRSVALTDL